MADLVLSFAALAQSLGAVQATLAVGSSSPSAQPLALPTTTSQAAAVPALVTPAGLGLGSGSGVHARSGGLARSVAAPSHRGASTTAVPHLGGSSLLPGRTQAVHSLAQETPPCPVPLLGGASLLLGHAHDVHSLAQETPPILVTQARILRIFNLFILYVIISPFLALSPFIVMIVNLFLVRSKLSLESSTNLEVKLFDDVTVDVFCHGGTREVGEALRGRQKLGTAV
ncbi:unnamed protein product [Caenorhabditis auriculariae]|uniref:Uncharacterized protein n=1 Tax=Caenorhabditis auriculariae TaxID=2777116 RepID=A0A8S1H081_9PELO|nr:unnamed protein product [Caenorhabditis auriculariae]